MHIGSKKIVCLYWRVTSMYMQPAVRRSWAAGELLHQLFPQLH